MTHDCAVTYDEHYLITADETGGGHIKIWDISDYDNINFFKPGLAYSFKHGCVFPNDIKQNTLRQLPICIFDDAQDRDEVLNELWRSSEAMG